MTMTRCTYLLPIRRKAFLAREAMILRNYMATLRHAGCEVLVVNGSPQECFARHEQVWSPVCRHERVDPRFCFLNGKVNGIHTGAQLATNEKIVLADDDIRYTEAEIDQVLELLDQFDVVRPQNYPGDICSGRPLAGIRLPVWAKMEAARMLINRATLRNADYPGTCAFRRSSMVASGDYDGDVLFDNEELIRHFARAGARICYANDLFVAKTPPAFRKWLEQRPRQAYEDFGLRLKTLFFAALLPATIASALIDWRWLALYLLSVGLAELGRLRGRARRYFPFQVCCYAPLWVLERALSTYWAFYWFLTRGGYPFGDRVLSKGIGRDWVEGGKIAARQ